MTFSGILLNNAPSLAQQRRALWRAFAITTLCTASILACASTVTTQTARTATSSPSAVVSRGSVHTTLPGIPDLPDLVTVVPFYTKPNETPAEQTKVIIPAEINGRRGNFVVDVGATDLSLNRTFLRPNAMNEVDTVFAADTMESNRDPQWGGEDSAHAILHIGTLTIDVVDPSFHQPNPQHFNAFLDHAWGNYSWVFAPRLGNIGLTVLEPFETIIDYTHRRLILIRLDNAGHRLVQVPAYTARWSEPLIDVPMTYRGESWWGVAVQPDNTLDTRTPAKNTATKVIDTGSPDNSGGYPPLLGYPFLSQLGIVGFNHRTHQFILYQ